VFLVGSSLDGRRRHWALSGWSRMLFKVSYRLPIFMSPLFGIDNDFSLLPWLCVFFAFYTLIVQFVLDPRGIEEEKEEMEPCISIQLSSSVRFWVSGRVFGYLFI
jgi:hypothetical protein